LSEPRILICSSQESTAIAKALQENLSDELDAQLWTEAMLPLSSPILGGLEKRIDAVDFAAFIFAPDDELLLRGEATKAVRDNVILELGIARGSLGAERAFIVRPADDSDPLRTATDIAGLVSAVYSAFDAASKDTETRRGALRKAAISIKSTASELGPRNIPFAAADKAKRRVTGVLPRGGTESLAEQADAAIYVADKRDNYFEELRGFVKDRKIVPSKYLYWTPQGSAHWLEFCELEQYKFYADSVLVLERHARSIAQKIVEATGTAELDYVSVGSGDGIKDNLILRELHNKLLPDEYIYYYPVDISDMLIIEAVRNVLQGLPKDKFRVKALIADFVRLEKLQAFYEERRSPNIFSVLGNTVGNADERKLIKSLAEAMLPGDLVLIEVNAGKPDIGDPVWNDVVTREHDFTPLTVLNVAFDPDLVEYKPIKNASAVQGTQSILASCKEAKIEGDLARDIKLSIVHYYDYEQFLSYMARKLKVTVLWSTPKPEKGIYLALGMREKAESSA
jgi:uncharacterized SAM-dependent methyltransferase